MQSEPPTVPAVTVAATDVSPGATWAETSSVRVSQRQESAAEYEQWSCPLHASGPFVRVPAPPVNASVSPLAGPDPASSPHGSGTVGTNGLHCPSTTVYVVFAMKGGAGTVPKPVIVVVTDDPISSSLPS